MPRNHKHVLGHEVLKVNSKIKHVDGISYQVTEILRFLPSFQYNRTRWYVLASHSTKNYI